MQLQSTDTASEPKRRARREQHKPISVTINDACQMLGIGRSMAYLLIGQGKLRSVCIGKRRVVLVASIEALIEKAAA